MNATELFSKLKTTTLEFGKSQLAALNGLLGQLPDSLKASFTSLRDSLQARQTELEAFFASAPATDADAVSAFNHLTGAFTKLQDYAGGLFTQLQAALTTGNETRTALQGLEKKVTDGELLDKNKIKSLTDTAFQSGVDSVLPQLKALRKQAVALAGLPEAKDDFLALPQDQFDAAVTAAKGNVKTLGDKFGFALNGNGKEWIQDLAFQPADEFAKSVKKIEAVLPARRPGGDPLLQGGGGPTGSRRVGMA